MAEGWGYRGYVTSRGFGGYRIPVPVQSLVLRDYCTRRGFLYALPVNENIFPGSYMVLEGLVQSLAGYNGIVMCSMHMLPLRVERRRRFIDRVLAQSATLHFVLEEAVIANARDIERVEDTIRLNELAACERAALPVE